MLQETEDRSNAPARAVCGSATSGPTARL